MTTEDYTTYHEESRPQRLRRKYAWYVWAMRQGKPIMIGGYNSESEAHEEGNKHLDCSFEVVELPTIDRNAAWGMLRKQMLNKGKELDNILRRVTHEKGLERQQQRKY